MRQIRYIVIFIFLLLGLASCDSKRVFESYQTIDKNGWNKDSLMVFDALIGDTTRNYNLFVNIRNEGSYAYSNLWLFLTINSPDGKMRTDTVEFSLAEPSGRWKGSGIGDLYDNQLPFKKSVYFPRKGIYSFSIKQGMRENVLKGIRDIGIRVEKTY
jgi:gliding motility-associated lipoprotein GldH